MGVLTSFDQNAPLYFIYIAVGVGSIAAWVYLTYQTNSMLTEWKSVLITLGAWLLGAAFYFYMPIASATNPPMNWATRARSTGSSTPSPAASTRRRIPATFLPIRSVFCCS